MPGRPGPLRAVLPAVAAGQPCAARPHRTARRSAIPCRWARSWLAARSAQRLPLRGDPARGRQPAAGGVPGGHAAGGGAGPSAWWPRRACWTCSGTRWCCIRWATAARDVPVQRHRCSCRRAGSTPAALAPDPQFAAADADRVRVRSPCRSRCWWIRRCSPGRTARQYDLTPAGSAAGATERVRPKMRPTWQPPTSRWSMHRALVREAYAALGPPRFDRYDFLLALTEQLRRHRPRASSLQRELAVAGLLPRAGTQDVDATRPAGARDSRIPGTASTGVRRGCGRRTTTRPCRTTCCGCTRA